MAEINTSVNKLTKNQLNSMKKDDLVALIIRFQEIDSVEIFSKIEDLSILIRKLTDENSSLVHVNSRLVDRVVKAERSIYNLEQYSRRDSIEIAGIPVEVEDDEIEPAVINLLSNIDVIVSNDEIQACHRLKKKERVICKFINRKFAEGAKMNSKKLKIIDKDKLSFNAKGNLYINESLCPAFRKIHWKSKKLWEGKLVESFWTHNGLVKIKIGENTHVLSHDSDIDKLFPDLVDGFFR